MQHHVLPNGIAIQHRNPYETAVIYKDIFEDRVYLRYNIDIPENACVLDGGANIGLFTLFVKNLRPSASIYSIEPAPQTFEVLKANTSSLEKVKLYMCGLGAEDKHAVFTYFAKVTCGSGFYTDADLKRQREMVRSAILGDAEKAKKFQGPMGEELLNYLLEERLQNQAVSVRIRPISDIIDENSIQSVDLFKVDVEGSERDVLRGIREDHWPIIRQMVLEVHDSQNTLPHIVSVLKERGYTVDTVAESSGHVTMTYARRPLA